VDWKAVWPVPALGLALVALAGALVVGVMRAPKADPLVPLRAAEALADEARFEEAIALLNQRVAPSIAAGDLVPAQRARFHVLRARAIFEGQRRLGISREENYAAVVKDLTAAEDLGARLEPPELAMLAESRLMTGDVQGAIDTTRRLPTGERARRLDLLCRIIEHELQQRTPRYDQTIALLAEVLDTPDLPVDRRAWAVARQTELRLGAGYYDEAVAHLLRSLPRLDAAGLSDERRGELIAMLGRAYAEMGQPVQAGDQFQLALRSLPPYSPIRAETELAYAGVLQSRGELEEARARYARVRTDYRDSPAALAAVLGLAEASAGLGEDEESLKAFAEVLDLLPRTPARRDVTPAIVADRLIARAEERFRREDPLRALQFAVLAEHALRLASAERPAALLLLTAQAHQLAAEQALGEAGLDPADHRASAPELSRLSPVARTAIRRHRIEAGVHFRDHARLMVVADSAAYLRSLWSAAENFDAGGDRSAAREAFQAYIDGAADDDPRKPEARFRLAMLFMADRDHVTAASLFGQLRNAGQSAGDRGGRTAGLWADRALVPLARCLLLDADPGNDQEGLRLLTEVVAGTIVSPESPEFREALRELGEQHYARGEHADAVARLSEVLARYPEARADVGLRFKLADANRQSAAQIAVELRGSIPQRKRQELEATRTQRLREAVTGFRGVLDDLTAKAMAHQPPLPAQSTPGASGVPAFARGLSPLERVYQRNAMFYLADCYFELGEFSEAIAHYDTAAQQYADEPSSLVALTQIVAAYAAQGRWNEARTANDRARRQLAALPDSAWENPDLPMQRRHWERWFQTSLMLEERARQATVRPRGTP
jgi:tetratricopeptide (TPR) repeat protein